MISNEEKYKQPKTFKSSFSFEILINQIDDAKLVVNNTLPEEIVEIVAKSCLSITIDLKSSNRGSKYDFHKEMFPKFTKQELCSTPFLDKIADWKLEASSAIKRGLQDRWLSVNFAAFLRKLI